MRHLKLYVASMNCRHCVREVTAWLRDVPGVETVVADASSCTVVLSGTMTSSDVLAAFAGSTYVPVIEADPPAATPR